jgi:hypothetical protein
MRYPIVRVNTDGSRVVVRNREEAYAEPERIAAFLPDAKIPEGAPREPVTSEDDGTESAQVEDTVTTAKRGPGRPKKVLA